MTIKIATICRSPGWLGSRIAQCWTILFVDGMGELSGTLKVSDSDLYLWHRRVPGWPDHEDMKEVTPILKNEKVKGNVDCLGEQLTKLEEAFEAYQLRQL